MTTSVVVSIGQWRSLFAGRTRNTSAIVNDIIDQPLFSFNAYLVVVMCRAFNMQSLVCELLFAHQCLWLDVSSLIDFVFGFQTIITLSNSFNKIEQYIAFV